MSLMSIIQISLKIIVTFFRNNCNYVCFYHAYKRFLAASISNISQLDSVLSKEAAITYLLQGLCIFSGWSLCQVMPESSHIPIRVHPVFIQKCLKCVMLTGSSLTKHVLEDSQLYHGPMRLQDFKEQLRSYLFKLLKRTFYMKSEGAHSGWIGVQTMQGLIIFVFLKPLMLECRVHVSSPTNS